MDLLVKCAIELRHTALNYDILNTHSHYVVGLKWGQRYEAPSDWKEKTLKEFIHLVNRRYGCYFRNKYPGFSGPLFQRIGNNYAEKSCNDQFMNAMSYAHANSCEAHIYSVYEDNPFCSFALYLASYIQNPEFQELPVIKHVTTSPDYLNVFNAVDFEYVISQYDPKSFKNGVLKFSKHHYRVLYKVNKNSTERQKVLGIWPLIQNLKNLDALQIYKTKGHKINIFIDSINGTKSNAQIKKVNSRRTKENNEDARDTGDTENIKEYFRTFCAFFTNEPYGKDALISIRKAHPATFKSFVNEMTQIGSERLISKLAFVYRKTLRKMRAH